MENDNKFNLNNITASSCVTAIYNFGTSLSSLALNVNSLDQSIMYYNHTTNHFIGRCDYCGVKAKEEERFCIACGAPL